MKLLSKIYNWTLLAPALLPLFFVEGMMYPLMAPKTFVLRALGLLALALFSYLALSGQAFYYGRLRNKLTWLPGALLIVAYAASLFGADFYRSFWSTFERGDGLLTLTVCVGYFYLLVLSLDRALLDRLMKLVAWVGSIAALYLILQWFETLGAFDLPFIVRPNGRVGGTLGNAAFAASYLGMAFFVTLAAAREYGSGRARRLLYAGAALELVAILLTATRGTILALAIVTLACMAYRLIIQKENRRVYALILGAVLLTGGALFAFRGPLSQVQFEPVRRLASISLTDATVASRLFLWRTLSEEALKKPLLGYGAEHIGIPFNRVYDPTVIQEEWFDRSHNAYLDYVLQFGLAGGALYVALILVFLYLAWRRFQEGGQVGFWLLLLGSVYALQNIFVFDTGVTLWLFLALMAVLFAREGTRATARNVRFPAIGWAVTVIILYFIVPVAVQPLRANLLAFEAYLYQIVDVPRANAAAEKVLALRTYADLELGYNAYFMYTEEQLNRLSGENLQKAYENAAHILTRNSERFPYDARTAVYLAQVLASAPLGTEDNEALLKAVLRRAIEESPKRHQPWYVLANIAIGNANAYPAGSRERVEGYGDAKKVLREYIKLVPNLSESHFILAQLEYASGDKDSASREAARGRELYGGNLQTARRAAQYYESVLDLPNAAFFLREILRFTPGDENAAADLAQIEAYETSNR